MNIIEEILSVYPCDKDCRFSELHTMTTLAYYRPIYDKKGNNINPDRNTKYNTLRCSVCDKTFNVTLKYGEEPIIEMK